MFTNDSKAIRKSFLRQLLEVFVTLSLGIGLVAPVIIFWTSWQQVRIYSERTADQIAAVFANDVRYSLLVGSGKDAKTVVDNIVKFPDVLHAEVFDVRDRPLAVGNAREAANARRTFAIERVVTVDATASSSALEDGQSTSADVGRVRLAVSLDRAYGSSLATAYYAAAQIAALTLLLSAALIRVSMKMLAPLAQLVRVLGSGDGGASLPSISARSPAEVHVIYEAIDSMQRRIADDNRRLIRYANGLETMVSERTRALESACDEAERANRAKTLFLANVSHELRTPLQAIILHARLMSGGPEQDRARSSLDTILRSSSHLLDLIDQLLNLSKAESGHPLELSYSSFGVRDAIEEAVSTVRPTLGSGNALTVHCAGDDIAIVSDRTRLLQVMYNLLRNADKFTTGGRIALAVDRLYDPDRIRLTISDEGIGIAQEQIARIFDPFFQGRTARGTVSSGIGIGLWVTKSIVVALGGRIDVSSTLGAGTTFRVEIPIAPRARVTGIVAQRSDGGKEIAGEHRQASRGLRVLFAEDEWVIRDAMSAFLRGAGYVLDECADGGSALAMLHSSHRVYDVVVLDHRMPGHTGLEILKAMRDTLHLDTPAIVLTGNDTSQLREEAARYRAALIAKPVQPETLIAAIASAADGGASTLNRPAR